MFVADEDLTTFTGNIQKMDAVVQRQDIRAVPHRGPREHSLGAEISQQQHGIAVAGHEGQVLRSVNEQPVAEIAARERITR